MKSRRGWGTVVALLFGFVVFVTLVGSLSGGDNDTESRMRAIELPTVTQQATAVSKPSPTKLIGGPVIDVEATAGIEATVTSFFRLYNEGRMVEATAYESLMLDRKCGGPVEHALAYVKLQDSEHLRYDVTDIAIEGLSRHKAVVTVTYSEADIDTGLWMGYGLVIVEVAREELWKDWLFVEAAIPWVVIYC